MPSIFMGAMGGAGAALSDVGSTLLKDSLASDARVQESNLALERARTLEVFKQQLGDAPLNRLGAKARELAGQEVPQEPAEVRQLSGTIPGQDGTRGFVGDIGIVQRAINNLPEPDRTRAMEQLRAQLEGDQQTEAEKVAGKTRKRTADEALDAAVDDAKINDLPAYARYEEKVGKPKRDERRVANQEQREETRARAADAESARRAAADERRFLVDMARLDLQQGNLDAQNRKIDALIEKWERDADAKDKGKAPTAERLTTIINSTTTMIRELDANKPSASKAEALADWQAQRDNAVRVRARAIARLNANLDGGDEATPPTPAAPAAPPKPAASRPPLSSFMK